MLLPLCVPAAPTRLRRLGRCAAPALGLLALAGAAHGASITGVCPDGSVFIVSSARDIPCSGAKRVEPHRVPPLRPENLPRSYLWEVNREQIDPNNPYNLVDRAKKVRELGVEDGATAEGRPAPGNRPAPEAGAGLPQVASAPPSAPAARGLRPRDLRLTDGELRDLFYLVELSQRRTPASFVRDAKGGKESLRVSLAHSAAFETRVHDAGGGPGSVLLFSVQPSAAGRFLPNFTFVQGHLTFSPRRDDPSQLGVLSGKLGDLGKDELVLGYVVLPPVLDLRRSMDVYWDDHQIGTTFVR
jgi:hypothetical protein